MVSFVVVFNGEYCFAQGEDQLCDRFPVLPGQAYINLQEVDDLTAEVEVVVSLVEPSGDFLDEILQQVCLFRRKEDACKRSVS